LEGAVMPSTGLVGVTSPGAGQIETLSVTEGDSVEKGALLYTLDLDTATKNGSTQELVLNLLRSERELLNEQISYKAQINDETQKELTRKIDNLTAQIEQLGQQISMWRGFDDLTSREYKTF